MLGIGERTLYRKIKEYELVGMPAARIGAQPLPIRCRIAATHSTHAHDSPTAAERRQQDRRRRGDRAAGERRQGADGERRRRRRHADRRDGRAGGRRAGPRRRQRLRHRGRRAAAGRGQPRHEQDPRRPTICFASRTLGFRGEALASIAEVSRLVLRSRTADADCRRRAGSRRRRSRRPSRPCGCPVGTTIEVRNLFFNTPVRRKFLRSTQTEMGHVERGLHAAGAGPSAGPLHAARTTAGSLYDLPPVGRLAERIAAFFGHELAADLIAVESRDDGVRSRGYVANPSHSRANAPDAVPVSQRPRDPRPLAAARPGRGLSRAAADGPLSDLLSCDSTCRPSWST